MSSSPKNRGWLLYFGLLAVLTAIATATLVVYNYRQQLRPDTVETAIELWRAKGPKNYLMTYTEKTMTRSGETAGHVVVTVQGGEAVQVLVNGVPQSPTAERTMPGLLAAILEAARREREPGAGRAYIRATFHARTGAVIQYVRSVMQTRDRIEINVDALEPRDPRP